MILILTILAFGDAYGLISQGNPPQAYFDELGTGEFGEFVDFPGNYMGGIMYVYRMTLGDFTPSKFGKYNALLSWVLFVMCTMFNLIIMLNLLISIISESYAKISENIEAAAQQERASLVAENSFLIPASRKRSFCKQNKYLVVALDSSEAQETETVDVASAVESLKKQLTAKMDSTDARLTRVEDSVRAMRDEVGRKLDALSEARLLQQ